MKNLIYKEFKLSVHPLVYFFLALFSLVGLTPGYPLFISGIYFCISYTFLFIGINKGVTTNDLFYTINLPIKREDIVKARVLSTTVLQIIYTVLAIIVSVFREYVIYPSMSAESLAEVAKSEIPSLGISQIVPVIGAFLIGYAVFDLIYLTWFYKTGKSVVLNMFVGIIAIAFTIALLTIIPAFIPTLYNAYTIGHEDANYLMQFLSLFSGVIIWLISKLLIIKICTKNLLKLDF